MEGDVDHAMRNMLKPDIKPTDIKLTVHDSNSQTHHNSDNVLQRTDIIASSSEEKSLGKIRFW